MEKKLEIVNYPYNWYDCRLPYWVQLAITVLVNFHIDHSQKSTWQSIILSIAPENLQTMTTALVNYTKTTGVY